MQTQERQAAESAISPLLRNVANPTYAYVCAFVDELQRAGVRQIVVCPGSRSTPLAMACAAQPNLHVWMHIDERAAAFFALGMAKRSGQPVALLCTSGTAAANFLPAIVEAELSHVPLLALTADRPHELRDNGAPQTIDQNRLYGTHVKWFVEMALPEATNAALRYARTIADRAVAATLAIPAGPVHLNIPLREPLTPEPFADAPVPPNEQRDTIAWYGRADNAPYTAVHEAPQSTPGDMTLTHLVERVQHEPRGLIIVGPNVHIDLAVSLVQLARLTGYPILADPLSQLRSGKHDKSQVVSSYDAFLRLDDVVQCMEPRFVLRFGAMPTSKPVLTYLKHYLSCPLVVIDGNESWEEPTQLAAEMLHTDPVAFCNALNVLLAGSQPLSEGQQGQERQVWLRQWQQREQQTRHLLSTHMQGFSRPFEGRVFSELASLLPENATLYVGNSMPVRDLDTFFWDSGSTLHILGNRGANGIDGVTSSALGASAAVKREAGREGKPGRPQGYAPTILSDDVYHRDDSCSRPGPLGTDSTGIEPTVLVIGDLSFFHDIGGLIAAKLHALNLTIVLVNNDGGGIFSFLPQAAYPDHFEQLFGTPTGLDARYAVQMYGGTFERAENWEQFRSQVKRGMERSGLHVVEVRTDRDANVAMHRELWKHLSEMEDVK